RKVILSNMVTLDGFFEGPNKELDWQIVDGENKEYAIDLLSKVDALLFGRVTYQLMADYWPAAATNPSTPKSDLEIADKMNNLPKIVFSKTLQEVKWNNSRLVKENIAEEISKMKQQPGKDMVIFGSGSIVSTFMQHGLIDEYRIIVNPIVLGNGNPLFKGINGKQNLKLLNTKVFDSGIVILFYEPAQASS
ncbi:MAG TPA: dihydrofolate reductase family protein, partial [Candidatus Nitrosopolaris rasttigaisensis]|nr:dihydrofolate reductase family protein [Candidatus Nitrosopolaris rasttigaisensis]